MIYALDSNIISYWLKKDMVIAGRLSKVISQGNSIIIPPSAYYEIRRGFKHKDAPGKELAFSCICKVYGVGEMNLAAWEIASTLYGKCKRTGKTIEDTDILIASFCILNNYVLVTNNTKHFIEFDGLIYENWVR